jgi:hypothetical protein
MTEAELAKMAGVTMDDIDQLRKSRTTANVANRHGVTMDDVAQFLRGNDCSLSIDTHCYADAAADLDK